MLGIIGGIALFFLIFVIGSESGDDNNWTEIKVKKN